MTAQAAEEPAIRYDVRGAAAVVTAHNAEVGGDSLAGLDAHAMSRAGKSAAGED